MPGGPQINNRLLLAVGKIDFYMGANLLQAFDAVANKIPTVVVASMFQKDPQVLLVHPDAGVEKFADLKNLNILVSAEGVATYYQWLKSQYGFREEQVRPYTFNPQPFLVDKKLAMQGYVTSEPFVVEKQGGFKPRIFLLADQGFDTYSTTIEVRTDLVKKNPGARSALRRCLDHRLVQLHLRRQSQSERVDQEAQSGDDRRLDRVFRRQDARIRHRQLGQLFEAWRRYRE